MKLHFDLHAAAALAPGIDSVADLLRLQHGGQPPQETLTQIPQPLALPANERRRASLVVRLALACAAQALADSPFAVTALRMVFASDEGTGEVCHQMLESVTTHRELSPLLFHNSVHNAPSGYLSIAQQMQQPATSLSLGEESFACGLLCAVSEAVSSAQPVLYLCYDAPVKGPMQSLRDLGAASASAWIIDAARVSGPAPLARLRLDLRDAPEAASRPVPHWLPQACAANPSARALVALAQVLDPACPPVDRLALCGQQLHIERQQGDAPC
jgi:hypothetical protein